MPDQALINTRFFIYRPGKDQPEIGAHHLPLEPPFEDLEAMLRPVVGGAIELLPTIVEGEPADMFVYEFRGPEGFELNEAATSAYHDALRTVADDATMPEIRGVAVVFDRIVYPAGRRPR